MAKFAASFIFLTSTITITINLCMLVGVGAHYSYRIPALFIFGDSIFDAGNNHFNKNCTIQADFSPYGINFFHHPTGRFSNGRTVVDFIAQYLGLKLQKPYLQLEMELRNQSVKYYPSNGINFASAGSGLFPQTNIHMDVTPLQVQVQQLQALLYQNQIDPILLQNSLFLLESGSNDIFNYFLRSKTPKPVRNAYMQAMLAEVERFISQIYELGARRIAVFSLGPMGCAPARALLPEAPLDKCFGKMNRMIKDYNIALENLVDHLPVKFPGLKAVYGSIYTIVDRFLATPSRYGYAEMSRACCGNGPLGGTIQCGKEGYILCKNPNTYLFWDYFHPTEHTCRLIAKALWSGRRDQVRPFNLKALATLN